jgi:serine/threonine-protein kinase
MFERHEPSEVLVEAVGTDTAQRELRAALAASYELERELGRGGMATVYLARDLRHRRQVAVKVLHPELSAALGAERFLREIELTASLQHPHILPLFDSGAAGGPAGCSTRRPCAAATRR